MFVHVCTHVRMAGVLTRAAANGGLRSPSDGGGDRERDRGSRVVLAGNKGEAVGNIGGIRCNPSVCLSLCEMFVSLLPAIPLKLFIFQLLVILNPFSFSSLPSFSPYFLSV